MADATTPLHEPDQPRLTALKIGAAAVLVTIAAAIGVATLIAGRPAGAPAGPTGARPGEAQLQPAPAEDIAAYRADKERLLHGYAWVDRTRGVVRIPIERAMDLLAQQQGAKGTR